MRKILLLLFLLFSQITYSQSDNCGASATTLIPGLSCTYTVGNNSGFTDSDQGCTNGTEDDDGWFQFVATATSHTITVDGASGFDAVLGVYSNCSGTQPSGGTCIDITGDGGIETRTVTGLTIGNTYYICVHDYYTGSGTTYEICVTQPPAPPANDLCGTPGTLMESTTSACGTPVLGTTVAATTTTPGNCGTTGKDVWYTFTPTTTGQYNFQVTEVVDYGFSSTYVSLFSGSCGSLTQVSASCSVSSFAYPVTMGTTYFVNVRSTSSTTGVDFSLCAFPSPPPPGNDNCANATPFGVVPTDGTCVNLLNQTTAWATNSNVTPTGSCTTNSGTPDDDVWFSFVASATSTILEATWVSGLTDVYWHVFSSACSGSMTAILCTDTNTGGTMTGLTIGNTYYIRLYTYASSGSTVQNICLKTPPPPPANDLLINAIPITCGSVTSGTTVNATNDAAATCTTSITSPAVWYSYTAATTGTHVFSLCTGTSYDSKMAVYENINNTVGGLVCVLGNDDFCSTQSQVSASLVSGKNYVILVGGYSSNSGPFELTFTCPAACPIPTGLSASSVTDMSASLNWTENGGATTWDIEWGPTGFTQGMGTLITNTSTKPYVLSGLTSSTAYQWYVRAKCGGTDSNWSAVGSFTTTVAPPDCAAGVVLTCDVAETFISGTSGAWNGNPCYFSSPGGEKVYRFTSTNAGVYSIVVSAASGFVDYQYKLASGTCDNTGWTCIDDISSTGTYEIGSLLANTDYYILLDDENTTSSTHTFKIVCPAACPIPTGLSASSVTDVSASLNWTENGGATTWDIEWGPTGFTQGMGTMISATSTKPYTLSGLSATTGYQWYVRSKCGGAGDSGWSAVGSFTTLAAPPANNECANATVVMDGSIETGSTASATNIENLTPCSLGGGGGACAAGGTGTLMDFTKGVWFKYTSVEEGESITVDTDHAGTDFDTQIMVFKGACGSLVCVGGDDDGGDGTGDFGDSQFCFVAQDEGIDYYIYVDGYTSDVGNYELHVNVTPPAVPSNSDCATPIVLANADSGEIMNINFTGVASSMDADGTCAFTGEGDLFYSITTDANGGDVTVTAGVPATMDVALYVYDACDGTILGCKNDGGMGDDEVLTITALSLQGKGSSSSRTETIIVRVDHTGNGNLTLQAEGTALPIKITSFSAKAMEDYNMVEWTTAQEINNDYQLVEKSNDGQRWTTLEKVNARGDVNNGASYTVNDKDPYAVTYYRIKAVDYNASFEYSKVISVQRNDVKEMVIHAVRPNPTNANTFLDVDMVNDDQVSIVILNSSGIEVLNTNYQATKGNNTIELNTTDFANGLYMIKVQSSDKSMIQKLIKQ
jgi:hypothetical protein